jgi:hypothetical protein
MSGGFRTLVQALVGTLFAVLLVEVAVRIAHPFDKLEYIVDDELLWRLRPGQIGINALGFRGPELPADDGRPRVLFLGDSITFGAWVGDAETYSALVQRMAGDCVVSVNAGIPGWGVFQYETLLRRIGRELNAKVVVVDLGDSPNVQRQPFATESERENYLRLHRLMNAIREYSRLAIFIGRLLERLWMMLTARRVPTESSGQSRALAAFYAQLEANIQRLGAMRDLVASQGGALAVVVWPARDFPHNEAFLQAIRKWGSTTGVPIVDLTVPLAPLNEQQWRIPGDRHPNELGHRIAAQGIFETIAGWLRNSCDDAQDH